MLEVFNFLFEQYNTYAALDIILEIIAVIFGFLSVWFSKQNKIWVFPTGIIIKMGTIRRYDDQCILFYYEYLWLVCLDS